VEIKAMGASGLERLTKDEADFLKSPEPKAPDPRAQSGTEVGKSIHQRPKGRSEPADRCRQYSPFQLSIPPPNEGLGYEIKRHAGVTPQKLRLEIIGKRKIEAPLVVGMGHPTTEVRHGNLDQTAGPQDPVNFPHRGKDIMEVFENMMGFHQLEGVGPKGVRAPIQVPDKVGPGLGIKIHVQIPRDGKPARTKVEQGGPTSTGCFLSSHGREGR